MIGRIKCSIALTSVQAGFIWIWREKGGNGLAVGMRDPRANPIPTDDRCLINIYQQQLSQTHQQYLQTLI